MVEADSDAKQEQAQEHLEEKLEHATPEHERESEGEGVPEAPATLTAPSATPEGLTQASDAADLPTPPITGDEAESGSEGGAGEAAALPEPKALSDTTQTSTDPEALERASEQVEAREAQRDTQRVAESAHDEREQDQAEDRADAGEAPTGAGELSGSERDTGLGAIAEPVEGGGGGEAAGIGGGGGTAQSVPEPEPAPDTASGDPESGLAAASSLQPMQALQALNGVGTSIDNTAKAEGESLQSQMPAVEVGGDGSGGTAVVSAPEAEGAPSAEEMTNGAEQPTPEPEPAPEPGPAPTEGIAVPSVSNTQEGTVRREDAEAVAGSVDSMPTTDPSIDTSAGPPPVLAKTGAADPTQMQDQHAELDATVAQQSVQGATDVAQPAGENQVRDRTPRVALKAPKLATPAAGAAGAAVADDEAVGIVAEEQQGDEVRAAMAQAQGDMGAKRTEHQSKVTEEKNKSDAEISALKAENATQQQAEKSKVSAEVGRARADWSAEQNAEVRKTNDKAAKEIAKGNEDITKEEAKGNENANRELAKGEADAQAEKDKAEKEAAEKKREAQRKKEEDSGGIFGWIASKVTAFFSALKNAITKVFDAAKTLVKKAIDAAKKLAVAAIEVARKVVVGLIKAVGKALIALGDVLLAAFPNLKKRWRSFIDSKVKAAEDAVNRLADALKKGVTKLLDALGKAFEFLLDAYKKAMLAVLDVAQGVAMAAIKAAKAIADLVGTFVLLIKDIARGPMDWLSKLGAAAVDGIKNHLWKAFQRDVKQWFNAKLEEVLGLGTTVWNVLKSGGIKMAEVGNMAFEALKAAIPVALIQLLIEKLVAMIVPAAGAVMAIIEGLQAAWGTVQRILSAFGKFVAFLKAVKSGGAGPQFADMLSAAGIVVIDFVANWLLKRLRGPASKVGGKIKAIAQKIMAKIKRAAKKVGGAFKKVGAKIKVAFKKGKQKLSDWRAKRKAKKEATKAGKKDDPSKRKRDKEEERRRKREAAIAKVKPKVDALLAKGIGRSWLGARLRLLGLTSGLKSLSLKGKTIVARASPEVTIDSIDNVVLGTMLEPILIKAEMAYLRRYDQSRKTEEAGETPSLHHMPVNRDTAQIAEMRAKRDAGQAARAEGGEYRPPTGQATMPTEQGAEIWWRDRSSLNTAFVRKLPGMEGLPEKYANMIAKGSLKDVPMSALNPAQRSFLESLGSVERARKSGMIPAMDLASTLHQEGVIKSAEEVVAGRANPMAADKSSVAAHRDDEHKDYTKRRPAEMERIQAASDARRDSIGHIFKQLRALLSADHSIVTKAGGAAQGVAKAFDAWFQAQVSGAPADRHALVRLTHALVQKLVVFLKTYRS